MTPGNSNYYIKRGSIYQRGRRMSTILEPVMSLEEAKALLSYTEEALAADDNYDQMSERLEGACDGLRDAIERAEK